MSSRSAGLLELVARGKKDVFFTANPLVAFFHSVYIRYSPFVKELYVTRPRNTPEWGRWVDFDLDHRGDIVKNTHLRIELPSWLPANVHASNKSGLVTYDRLDTTYGYCNNIGFQMIEKIQLFQDQVIIHETYGEYLDWRLRQSYSLSKTYIVGAEIGAYSGSSLSIGRSASNLSLRVPFTILGWEALNDPGLPMVALRGERFKIRVFLRNLEEVIVCSNGQINPNPWLKSLRIQSVQDGPIDTSQKTLPKTCMKTIGMSLETTQIYLPNDVNIFLKAQALRFPFQTIQFQQFTLEDNLMTAASLNPLSLYKYPLRIDFSGSINRMLIGFRSDASTQAGERANLSSPVNSQQFITTMRLNVANIDRVKQWQTPVFKEVTSYWKNSRMALELTNPTVPQFVYTITFGGFDSNVPSGTMNFSRVVDPTLFLTLAPIEYDPRLISRKSYALLYAESWNIYEAANGKGRLMFDD